CTRQKRLSAMEAKRYKIDAMSVGVLLHTTGKQPDGLQAREMRLRTPGPVAFVVLIAVGAIEIAARRHFEHKARKWTHRQLYFSFVHNVCFLNTRAPRPIDGGVTPLELARSLGTCHS